jgi:hypothetical protein
MEKREKIDSQYQIIDYNKGSEVITIGDIDLFNILVQLLN